MSSLIIAIGLGRISSCIYVLLALSIQQGTPFPKFLPVLIVWLGEGCLLLILWIIGLAALMSFEVSLMHMDTY